MQTIYLDISNKGVIPCIQAKQSEVGRKFLAVITDNGVPYTIPENSLLSVWYEGDTDAGNYSSIEEKSAFSIDGNKVTVELVAQMLLKPGIGELCLSITHGDGGETNTWNISYCVEYKPGAGSSVPTEYYTALTEAGTIAAKYANQAKESAELVSSLFVESDQYDGCYYRLVENEMEWVNPPMVKGAEYRTTERIGNKVVYKRNNNGAIEYRLEGETQFKKYPELIGALPKTGGTMSGAINMDSKKITSLATPTANTDAANKKYVDDGLSNKQDAMELLWSNASTTSSFAAQTISLNLSGYDFVVVRLKSHTGGSSYIYALMRVRTESVANPVYSMVNLESENAAVVVCRRNISPYSAGVKFDDSIAKSVNEISAGVADNSRLVPVEIYGIKGVKM